MLHLLLRAIFDKLKVTPSFTKDLPKKTFKISLHRSFKLDSVSWNTQNLFYLRKRDRLHPSHNKCLKTDIGRFKSMAKGSIEKRGKNSWRLTVELGTDGQGERDFERKTIRVEDPDLLRAPRRLQNHLDEELV